MDPTLLMLLLNMMGGGQGQQQPQQQQTSYGGQMGGMNPGSLGELMYGMGGINPYGYGSQLGGVRRFPRTSSANSLVASNSRLGTQ